MTEGHPVHAGGPDAPPASFRAIDGGGGYPKDHCRGSVVWHASGRSAHGAPWRG